MDFAALVGRAIKASLLDVEFYNQVEQDTSLNQEALTVVIIVSALSGIGALLGTIFGPGSVGSGVAGLVIAVVMGIIGYYIWAYLTWWLGTNLFQGTADVGELLRTLGYASAPRALGFFAFIPCLGGLVGLIGAVWSLVAGVIAVREALDFDTGKALITVVIGWVIVTVITLVLAAIFGLSALGLGALKGGF